jgi:endoribonuclease Dicer
VSNEFQAERALASGLSKYLRPIRLCARKGHMSFEPPGMRAEPASSLWNGQISKVCVGVNDAIRSEDIEKNEEEEVADVLGKSSLQHCKAVLKSKRLADLVESIIGAFFLSGGIDTATYVCKALGLWPKQNEVPYDGLDKVNILSEQLIETVHFPPGYPPELSAIAELGDDDTFFTQDEISVVSNHHSLNLSDAIEHITGYTFRDDKLLSQAFTHSSITNSDNNQRLEYLGDAVLDLVVVAHLYETSTMNQGELSMKKSDLTNNNALGTLAIRLGLFRHLNVMSDDLQNAFKDIQIMLEDVGAENFLPRVAVEAMADCWEALIGALFLDCGQSLDIVNQVLCKVGILVSK